MFWSAVATGTCPLVAKVTNLWRNSTQLRIFVKQVVPECEGSWFDSGCTDEEYIVNFSGRYRELHGVTVRTDTPEQFMDDLKKYGYIRG